MARKKTTTETTPTSSARNEYTVLARRYRPQQFSEIIGQEAVAQSLANALKSNRVAHAYLFTGTRGVGKTSMARILAKALNCEKGPTPHPCDECSNCERIVASDDVDVLEIDAASHNKVEQIRDLRNSIQYLPSRSRYRIYIIDEVHLLKLSRASFDALLKTLEEPPPHVKFIMATTEAWNIPATILSRCQRFDFANISTAQIVEHLRGIVATERRTVDDAALELLARRADGSMRDAQSLLDQLFAFGESHLTTDQVHLLLGTAADDFVFNLATAVLERDAPKSLTLLGDLADQGIQYDEFLKQMIAYWRDLMVVNSCGKDFRGLSVPPHQLDGLIEQAQSVSLGTVLAGLDILSTTRMRLKNSPYGRILVEMALVRLCRLEDLVSVSELAQSLRNAPADGAPQSASRPATLGSTLKKNNLTPNSTPAATAPGHSEPQALTPESLPALWEHLLAKVGQFFGQHLRLAQFPAISGPKALEILFPSDYNAQWNYCQQPERVRQLEKALAELTGEEWQVKVVLGTEPAPEGARPRASAHPNGESPLSRQRRLKEEIRELPLIQRAIEVLDAEIRRVDDGFASTEKEAVTSSDSPDEPRGDDEEA